MTSPILILASHGRMSVEALNSAKQILGDFDSARAVAFEMGQSLDAFAASMSAAIEELDPEGDRPAVLLVDLFGGSCSNIAVKLMRARARKGSLMVLAGFNLAMILEFASSRDRFDPDELVTRMVTAGQKACFDVGRKFGSQSAASSNGAPPGGGRATVS